MDIILILLVVIGVIIRAKGRKISDKNLENIGNVMALVSAVIVTIIWVSSCLRAIPK